MDISSTYGWVLMRSTFLNEAFRISAGNRAVSYLCVFYFLLQQFDNAEGLRGQTLNTSATFGLVLICSIF